MDFDRFALVLLYRTEAADLMAPEDALTLQNAHLDHLATLRESGAIVGAGPLSDGPDERLRGVSLFARDVSTACELAAADPAVEGGMFRIEAVTWHVPAGAIQAGPARFPHSVAETRGD